MFFVLAACKTSYARGLKQMELADDYFLAVAQPGFLFGRGQSLTSSDFKL